MVKRIRKPLPPILLLQDRADGTWWQLTHRQSDNRWAIRDDVVPYPLSAEVHRYAPYDGPTVAWGSGKIRLLVRGGRFGYEVIDFGPGTSDRDNAPVYSRRGPTAYCLVVTQGGWVADGDHIGWDVGVGTES